MKNMKRLSKRYSDEGNENTEQMVQSVHDDFALLAGELKEGMDFAGEVGDETTGDMLLAIHQGLEKHN